MALHTFLNRFYDAKIKIQSDDRTSALKAWEPVVKQILEEVRRNDPRFSLFLHYTGSFYERAKTEQPDEFDLMLEIQNVNVETPSRVSVCGFTTATITDPRSKADWDHRDAIVDRQGRLNAVQIKAVFSRLVIAAIRRFDLNQQISMSMHGPAVTLHFRSGSNQLDVDLTLAIKLKEWPSVAKSWKSRPRRGWPSQQLLYAMDNAGCFIVAKQPENYGADKAFFWRFSFSMAEKVIMTSMDQGIPNSCRRKVLQILKYIISNDRQLASAPLRSYHMKTLIFWESEIFSNREDWDGSKIGQRFLGAVDRFLDFVRNRSFPHYFLSDFNLFEDFMEPHFEQIWLKFQRIRADPVQYMSSLQN